MTLKWDLITKGMRPHGQLQQKLQQKSVNWRFISALPARRFELACRSRKASSTALLYGHRDALAALKYFARPESSG